MRVGINVSNLHSFSKKRGIGFYTENLIDSLKKYTDAELIVVKSKEQKNNSLELIHYPYFDFFKTTLPLNKKIPSVVTIHDVIPLKFPEHYPPGLKGKINNLIQKHSLKSVNAVITDSNSSKKDIEEVLKIKNDKIYSIYLAAAEFYKRIIDKKVLGQVKKKYSLPEEFVLYVGSVNWNKNLNNLADACVKAQRHLVLVGGDFLKRDNLNHPELKSFKDFLSEYENHPNIHMVGFVDDEELVSFYNLATVSVLVSYYEGFGLPILESQVCGTPVIVGNNSSMIEVGGNSVVKVNPDNAFDIAFAINQIFVNKKLRIELKNKGFKNIKKFSWEKVANQTYQVYSKVLEDEKKY